MTAHYADEAAPTAELSPACPNSRSIYIGLGRSSWTSGCDLTVPVSGSGVAPGHWTSRCLRSASLHGILARCVCAQNRNRATLARLMNISASLYRYPRFLATSLISLSATVKMDLLAIFPGR